MFFFRRKTSPVCVQNASIVGHRVRLNVEWLERRDCPAQLQITIHPLTATPPPPPPAIVGYTPNPSLGLENAAKVYSVSTSPITSLIETCLRDAGTAGKVTKFFVEAPGRVLDFTVNFEKELFASGDSYKATFVASGQTVTSSTISGVIAKVAEKSVIGAAELITGLTVSAPVSIAVGVAAGVGTAFYMAFGYDPINEFLGSSLEHAYDAIKASLINSGYSQNNDPTFAQPGLVTDTTGATIGSFSEVSNPSANVSKHFSLFSGANGTGGILTDIINFISPSTSQSALSFVQNSYDPPNGLTEQRAYYSALDGLGSETWTDDRTLVQRTNGATTLTVSISGAGGVSDVSGATVSVAPGSQAIITGDNNSVSTGDGAFCVVSGDDDTLTTSSGESVSTAVSGGAVLVYRSHLFNSDQLLASFSGQLGALLAGSNPFARIAGSSITATIAENARSLAGIGTSWLSDLGSAYNSQSTLDAALDQAIEHLGSGVVQRLQTGSISALGPLLVADAAQRLGISGFAGQLFTATGTTIFNQLLTNIANSGSELSTTNLLAGFNTAQLVESVGTSLGSLIGSNIAGQIIDINSVGQSLFAAVGGNYIGLTYGTSIASTLGTVALPWTSLTSLTVSEIIDSLILPGIGTILGTIAGEAIGAEVYTFFDNITGGLFTRLFSPSVWEYQYIAYDQVTGQFYTSESLDQTKNTEADLRAGTHSITNVILASINSILKSIKGQVDPFSTQNTAWVEWVGKNKPWGTEDYTLGYNNAAGQTVRVRSAGSPDRLVRDGIEFDLSQLNFLNGDPVKLRAFTAWKQSVSDPGSGASLSTLAANLQIADDYNRYLDNTAAINALIVAAPDSAFAVGWMSTLIQAEAMGLNKPYVIPVTNANASGPGSLSQAMRDAELLGLANIDFKFTAPTVDLTTADAAIHRYSLETQNVGPSAVLFRNIGELYQAEGNLPAAIYAYTRALALDPSKPVYYVQIAELYREVNDLRDFNFTAPTVDRATADAAIYRYSLEIQNVGPSAVLFRNIGELYQAEGNLLAAIYAYTRALALDPSKPVYYVQIAELYRQDNDLRSAAYAYNQALGLDSTLKPVWASLAATDVQIAVSSTGAQKVTDLMSLAYTYSRLLGLDPSATSLWVSLSSTQGQLAALTTGAERFEHLQSAAYADLRALQVDTTLVDVKANLDATQSQLASLLVEAANQSIATSSQIAAYIASLQLPNGAIITTTNPAGYDAAGNKYFLADVYFSGTALYWALEEPATGVNLLAVTRNWLEWCFSSTDSYGMLMRNYLYADGTAAAPPIPPDAQDSNSAMILAVLAKYVAKGGDTTFLNTPSMKVQVELVAKVMLDLQQANGLTWGSAGYPISDTEDNAEVFGGFRSAAYIEEVVFGDLAQARVYAAAADRVQTGIMTLLYNTTGNGLFDWALNTPSDLSKGWYPDTISQVWPILYGVIDPASPIARSLVAAINTSWSGHADPQYNWQQRADASSVALAMWMTGDAAGVQRAMLTIAQAPFPVNGYPLYNTTVADCGMALVLEGVFSASASAPGAFVPAPAISNLTHAVVSLSHGTIVTLTGTNFDGAYAVYFGTTTGTILSKSATQITALCPPGQIGTINVSILARGGVSSATIPSTIALAATTGLQQFAVGSDEGGPAVVTEYNSDGSTANTYTPFPNTTGGVRTAVGDFNGDGVPDVLTGTGPGATAEVKVIDGRTGTVLFDVFPFEGFTGGVFIAAGDLTGDGVSDYVITPDQGGGPRVEIYRGGDFVEIANFFGIDDPNFRGGARASLGDINGDSISDLVVSAGFGGGPRVAVFDGATVHTGATPVKLTADFFLFEDSLRNGAYVALGDVNGDGFADIIGGGGPGGGPRVFIISGERLLSAGPTAAEVSPIANFYAGDVNSRGGVRVAAKDLDGDLLADIVTASGNAAGGQVSMYLAKNLLAGSVATDSTFEAYPGFNGGLFVG